MMINSYQPNKKPLMIKGCYFIDKRLMNIIRFVD